jgi:hypothetical protein
LEILARSRRLPAAQVKRARMLLLLDDGLSWSAVSRVFFGLPPATERQAEDQAPPS